MKKLLAKIHLPVWLIVLLVIILILRIPSFFEPYTYGDEMIYLSLGQAIRQGIPLYSGIHDNKPPLLYLTAAIAGNLFWFKAILAFWMLGTTVLFSKFAKIFLRNKNKAVVVSTIIFAILTTLPFLEGNIVNAELFMIGPIMGALMILLAKPKNTINLLLAGSLFSIASLFKMPAAFDFPAIIVFWLLFQTPKKGAWRKTIKEIIILMAGFIIPIVVSFLWFYAQGAGKDYLIAAYLQNVGYLSSFRPGDVQKSFLAKNLPLLIRATLVLIGLLVLFIKRKALSWEFSFICLWLLFGLFAVTLSERPYPHYLIQIVPQATILLGMLLTKKTKEQVLTIIPLSLIVFIPVYYHYYHYPTYSYYLRFFNLITRSINTSEYLNSFGETSVRNYQIANFLVSSSLPNDKVFIVGDSPAIYALSRRLPPGKYVAGYHINDFSSMEKEAEILNQTPPTYIVILPEKFNLIPIVPLLREKYILVYEIGNTEIWKLRTLLK